MGHARHFPQAPRRQRHHRARRGRLPDRRDAAAGERPGTVVVERDLCLRSVGADDRVRRRLRQPVPAHGRAARRDAPARRGDGRNRARPGREPRCAFHARPEFARQRASVPPAQPLLPVRHARVARARDRGQRLARIRPGRGDPRLDPRRHRVPLRHERRLDGRCGDARARRRRVPRLRPRRHRPDTRVADPGADGGRLPARPRSDGPARVVRGVRRRPLVHVRCNPGRGARRPRRPRLRARRGGRRLHLELRPARDRRDEGLGRDRAAAAAAAAGAASARGARPSVATGAGTHNASAERFSRAARPGSPRRVRPARARRRGGSPRGSFVHRRH